MNRSLLAAAAPKWTQIEALPGQDQLELLGTYLDAVGHAIQLDHEEPDTWEALYMSYAIHALAAGRFYAALTYTEMMLREPHLRRAARLSADGPEPVAMADLKTALHMVMAQPANGAGTRET
jgi:hypothetical protein